MEHASPIGAFFIIVFGGVILFSLLRANRGFSFSIRKIRAIKAIDEAVDRAIESGRPVLFTTGMTGVGPLLYACLGILKHISVNTARLGAKLFAPCIDPEVLIFTQSTVQSAYRQEGKANQYDDSSVRFLADEQFAYASGYMGIAHRENVGAAFLFGTFAAESLILAEAGDQVGAMQIAGTTSNEQIPFFITTCDYTLLGEELYAAGAFFSNDPIQKASLRAQDLCKVTILFLIILGTIISTLSSLNIISEKWNLKNLLVLSWPDIFGAS
jgi:hypothetical protein